jgi:outer membrane protein assembly factor BamB
MDASNGRPRSRRNAGSDRRKGDPYLVAASDFDPSRIAVRPTRNPRAASTLGDAGLAVAVRGAARFDESVLVIPFERAALAGIAVESIRVFRVGARQASMEPIWKSGVNIGLGFIWAKIRRAGTYVPIGLPRDRVLRELMRAMAIERRYEDPHGDEHARMVRDRLAPLAEISSERIERLRTLVAILETQTGDTELIQDDMRLGHGGHIEPFALPGDVSFDDLKQRLADLRVLPGGLPEEALFFPPDDVGMTDPPWTGTVSTPLWERIDRASVAPYHLVDDGFKHVRFCALFSPDWWMYHHDVEHSGRASGCSDLSSTTVSGLIRRTVPLLEGGSVVTMPAVVGGKVYVGTYNAPDGGYLYRIDLATHTTDLPPFHVPTRSPAYAQGIGGTPAVVGGRVYFTNVAGLVYCIDANTFALIWCTDLRNPQQSHNQPVRNNFKGSDAGDCFSSPLVVNGRVYIGSGEGERNVFGFVFCLDAATGDVVWLFCTNQFQLGGADNAPNHIPRSAAISDPLPWWASEFTIQADPPHRGASVWSSCAYDRVLNRIYVGTGNSRPDDPLPDEKYASGLISLDATTGAYQGFFQPAPADSYRPKDLDVDVPCGPTVFQRGGERVVGFGSKNGSFFLLDPDTLQVLGGGNQRRQLLPRASGSGLPGDMGAIIPTVAIDGGGAVDPGFRENKWGVLGSAAVDGARQRLYIGIGGYAGIGDERVTPFVRAVDWTTLDDVWPWTNDTIDGRSVRRYSTARPPLYTTSEAGLSSPAVVNDVVFVSTSRPALYALDAGTGLCLWTSGQLPGYGYSLGPAIYGNYVVVGAGNTVYIFELPRRPWPVRDLVIDEVRQYRRPWPPPPPPPDGIRERLREVGEEIG